MKHTFLALFAFFAAASCCEVERAYDIIPYPASLEARCGDFDMRGAAVECDPAFGQEVKNAVGIFAGKLDEWRGDETIGGADPVKFTLDTSLAPEDYVLEIRRNRIDISASALNGAIYAIRTIEQLLPADYFGGERTGLWTVPCVKIRDTPRFGYRGMHMDPVRHFFDVAEVKRYLDIMSFHKLNTLHWHLTDDQGWRVEIKRYPELTLVGGFRDGTVIRKEWDNYDGIRYGGYYTQDQIREVVEYAASLGIAVIPEVDLPGHMLAALTAYPELGCTGGPYKVWGRWGVSEEVLCAGNPKTYEFIEGVLTEIMELFPSQYIHIGGDECPKIRWEACPKCQKKIEELGLEDTEKFTAEHYLQSYVMSRAEEFLASHGRRIIGWDEILEGEVSPEATIMSWRGTEGALEAVRTGRDAILTPTSHCYFDYYQSADSESEPFGIGGYVPIERVYSFDPSLGGELTAEESSRILGVQANLWTEYIATPEHLEYMLLPRLAALSEVQWSRDEAKEWSRFLNSLEQICDIYARRGYSFSTVVFGITGTYRVVPEKSCVELTLSTPGDKPIYYTLDGEEPTTTSTLYTAPIEIHSGCTIMAMADRGEGGIEARMYVKEFSGSKSFGHGATLNTEPHERYRFDGATLLTDGFYGPFSYASGAWIGYQMEPMDVTIAMGGGEEYSSVRCNVMIEMGEDLFPPSSITVFTSQDGTEFTQVAELAIPHALRSDKDRIESYTVDFSPTSAPFVRVVAKTPPEIPSWHPAAGRRPFIFVDEIAVN